MSLVETAIHKLKGSKPASAESVAHDGSVLSQPRVPGTSVADMASADRVNLPLAALRDGGLLPPEDREQQVTNQIRRVKRPLLAAATGTNSDQAPPVGRIIVVTSALSGEGKSFMSLNLALNLSLEKDFNVLLVDGDVAKRELSLSLGISDRAGLTELLTQPSLDISSCALATDVPGLFLMSAGAHGANAPELLGSTRMRAVFERFLERNPDYFVVFDSPPVLMAPESRALMTVGGQILFVVKAGDTRKPMVMEALSAIGSGRPISLLLNQVDAPPEKNYGYDYRKNSQRSLNE